jgi:hypothetical protein
VADDEPAPGGVDARGDPAAVPPMIGLGAWRRQEWVPADVDHMREALFLDQYAEQAWRVHDVTAAALIAKSASADTEERQLLFLRLFAEYVNAIEVLGGWGWATRNRDQFKLLLNGFLAYAPGEVATFYETVAGDGRGDLADLLGLPPLRDIARAWADRAAEEVRQQDLLDEFARCTANLRQAASQYFDASSCS